LSKVESNNKLSQVKSKNNFCGGIQYPPIQSEDREHILVSTGMRAPQAIPYSFEKTEAERKAWKLVHKKAGPRASRQEAPIDVQSPKGRLTVHIINKPLAEKKKGSNTARTTESAICHFAEIGNIIVNVFKIKSSDIKHVYFNNKIIKRW
jgi:hypothetical protein